MFTLSHSSEPITLSNQCTLGLPSLRNVGASTSTPVNEDINGVNRMRDIDDYSSGHFINLSFDVILLVCSHTIASITLQLSRVT